MQICACWCELGDAIAANVWYLTQLFRPRKLKNFYTSGKFAWNVVTQANQELIDVFGLTCPVVSEKVGKHYVFIHPSDAKNILQVI